MKEEEPKKERLVGLLGAWKKKERAKEY